MQLTKVLAKGTAISFFPHFLNIRLNGIITPSSCISKAISHDSNVGLDQCFLGDESSREPTCLIFKYLLYFANTLQDNQVMGFC